MDFMEAVKTCLLRKYCSFSGRASRSEFWWFWLFSTLVESAAGVISDRFSIIIGILLLLPHLGVSCRRLHDRDMSGWWVVGPAFSLIGFSGLMLFAIGIGSLLLGTLSFFGLIAGMVWGIVIYAKAGTPSANRFGLPEGVAVPSSASEMQAHGSLLPGGGVQDMHAGRSAVESSVGKGMEASTSASDDAWSALRSVPGEKHGPSACSENGSNSMEREPFPAPKFCAACGTRIEPEARFCTGCGRPLR